MVLHANPIPEDEKCHQPSCRRIFAFFGPSYKHSLLNEATHREIPQMFGVSSVRAFEHVGLDWREMLDREAARPDRIDAVVVATNVAAADHWIERRETFLASLARAARVAEKGVLVTLGIVPDHPATGYGYIRRGNLLESRLICVSVALPRR